MAKPADKRPITDIIHSVSHRRFFLLRNPRRINLRPHFHKRHPFIAFIVVLLLVASFSMLLHFNTKAEIVDLYPNTCLGDWSNMQHAQGKPESLGTDVPVLESNSAVRQNVSDGIYCGGFLDSNSPTKGQIKSVGLTLVWKIGKDASPEESPIKNEIPTASSTEPTSTTSFYGRFLNVAFAQDAGSEIAPVPNPVNSPDSESPYNSPQTPSEGQTSIFETGSSTTLIQADTSTNSEVGSSSTISIPVMPVVDNTFLELSYNLDGKNWIPVSKIGVDNWKDFTVAIPISSWEDIKNLQIKIKDAQTSLSDAPPVMLDGMILEVTYSGDESTERVPIRINRFGSGNRITVAVDFNNITDIDGCDIDKCKYWQMHFERKVGDYNIYYSSDVYPATQLTATYEFNLPSGEYSNFVLGGYEGDKIGVCGIEKGGNTDRCPDGKHITDVGWGLKTIDDPNFILYPLNIGTTSVLVDPAYSVDTSTISQ